MSVSIIVKAVVIIASLMSTEAAAWGIHTTSVSIPCLSCEDLFHRVSVSPCPRGPLDCGACVDGFQVVAKLSGGEEDFCVWPRRTYLQWVQEVFNMAPSTMPPEPSARRFTPPTKILEFLLKYSEPDGPAGTAEDVMRGGTPGAIVHQPNPTPPGGNPGGLQQATAPVEIILIVVGCLVVVALMVAGALYYNNRKKGNSAAGLRGGVTPPGGGLQPSAPFGRAHDGEEFVRSRPAPNQPQGLLIQAPQKKQTTGISPMPSLDTPDEDGDRSITEMTPMLTDSTQIQERTLPIGLPMIEGFIGDAGGHVVADLAAARRENRSNNPFSTDGFITDGGEISETESAAAT